MTAFLIFRASLGMANDIIILVRSSTRMLRSVFFDPRTSNNDR